LYIAFIVFQWRSLYFLTFFSSNSFDLPPFFSAHEVSAIWRG